jgi:hypothetical protein
MCAFGCSDNALTHSVNLTGARMPKARQAPISLDNDEKAYSARARARNLREVARFTRDTNAKALLEIRAKRWDEEANEAASLAFGEGPDMIRHKRINEPSAQR